MADDYQNLRRALRAVTPTRLTDDVAQQLRRYVIDNDLAPGSRLPSERALAEMLRTSRATVSQALRELALLGLIEIRQGSGAYVRHDPDAMFEASLDLLLELAPGSVTELADLRYWLELCVLDERWPHIDAEPLAHAFDAMAASNGSVPQWLKADAAFHMAFVAAMENRYLTLLYRNMHHKILSLTYSDWVRRGETPAWLRGRQLDHQLTLHRRIAETAADQDHEGLATALAEHQDHLVHHLAGALHVTS